MSDFQGQIDFMKSRFREAITSFDDMKANHSALNFLVSDATANLSSIIQNHENLSLIVRDLADKLASSAQSAEVRISGTSNALMGLSNGYESIKKDLSDLKASYESAKNVLSNLASGQSNLASVADLSTLSKDYQEFKKLFDVHQTTVSGSTEQLKASDNQQKSLISNLSCDLNTFKGSLSGLEPKLSQVSSDFSLLKSQIPALLEQLKASVLSAVEDKIKAIPQPVVPTLEEAKKDLQNQLEPVSLDAANAKLRAANNETKVTLLEKKLESLQLMVNQLQLKG